MAEDAGFTRRSLALLPVGAALASSAASGARPPRPSRIPLQDRADLEDLINVYAWAYDCGDDEAFADTFVEDGVVEAFGKEEARGREGLRAFARRLFEIRGNMHWQHYTSQHVFVGAGDRYTVYSFYGMLAGDIENRRFGVQSFGHYISECVRHRGEWRFVRRRIIRGSPRGLPWKSA